MLAQGPAVGVEAWVEGKDDKKRLNEHQVQHHPAKNGESSYTECFLETIDEAFVITLSKSDHRFDRHAFRSSLFIDGSVVKNTAWLKDSPSMEWDEVWEKEGNQMKKSYLKFAPLPTTDDQTKVTIDPLTMKSLGTIEITLERGKFRESGVQQVHTHQLKNGTIHEKGKKFAYSVTAADSTVCERPSMMHYTFTPDQNRKFTHRFIFRYRPRPVLVQMGIIDEPEPSPPPTPPRAARKRNADAIDIEAISEGEGEEGDVKPDLNAKRVKYLEEQVRLLADQLKRTRNGSKDKDDVVDLTLDDD
ncbi:hypothetical protein L486_03896 [Kwoniella mangroviensis CBS 10435]|uniref:DUF7918 domain-containing protein n=1 Tax=Kwoniella mangroviensis CBS 10435 TaxID=1331196 RepID=A0A1B9IQP0_9TREE|nr:hypothetical protein L486_03896 [Kwoniella mangroviensis CBS 10435]